MCGILGGFGQTFLSEDVSMLRHRGPDSSGFVNDGTVSLGHTRLSIQDLSNTGCQPLTSQDGNVVIVYNGEIYDYAQQKADLVTSGYSFKGHSDTEFILNLYLRDGFDMIAKLNGIFAFAIWDKRSKELFLARDGLGVTPLYHCESDDSFIFASELKLLFTNSKLNRKINYEAVASHLTYLWCPSPVTMLEGISKLEPGYALVVKDGAIKKKWCFYDLPYNSSLSKISETDAITETRRLVSQGVERQLISDVPVGAFLSGGLDSSAVVAFAKHHMPDKKIQTFSIDLQGEGVRSEGTVDDLPYAQRVAKHLDVDLNVVSVGPEIINDLEKMIYHLDEPQVDPAALNVLHISKLARQHGIKVLLSGAGGDDIFTGYRRHYALMQEQYWSWLPGGARNMLSCLSTKIPVSNHIIRRFAKSIHYSNLNGNKRIASYFYWLNPELIYDVLIPQFNNALLNYDVASPLMKTLERMPEDIHPLNKMLYLEAKHFLTDHNLNYTDKMGMAEGVEIRVPLLDPDLINFSASLPINYKQRGREGKWIFKKAMENMLPNDVIYRPKTGFGTPLRY